jgi:prepilin-type processing-associated H-X9-DG protein
MPFMVMSNQLSTAKIAYCPSDSYHSTAGTNFNYNGFAGVSGNTATAQNVAGTVSYFVNGDASESDPQMILSGDENIGYGTANNGAAGTGYCVSTSAGGSGTTPANPQAVGIPAAGTTTLTWATAVSSTGAGGMSWDNNFHSKAGNIVLADGSVQQVTISGLHTTLANSTNSYAQQSFNFPK